MTTDEDQRLMTREDVARQYGVSKRLLELLAIRGGGPKMIRLSRRYVRYRRSDIEAWIEACASQEEMGGE